MAAVSTATLFVITLLFGVAAAPGLAAEHEGRHGYRSEHWNFDARYHHDRYYPARGYVVSALPPGYLTIDFRTGRHFYHGGVWFRAVGPRYVVVAPPPGIAIPVLPPAYTSVWIGGVPYWYANGVYYARAAAGPGYLVVAPPAGYETAQMVEQDLPAARPTVPAPDLPASAPRSGDTMYIYPRSGQTDAQAARDRAECGRWATDQTGYEASRPDPADPRRSDFQRAMSACLEGRGYTVR